MSALSRFGPAVARSTLYLNQPRYMTSSSAALDPVQKLFADKIKEFRTNNIGLDETHRKAMAEEMLRLKRVYSIEDENKLAHLDYKFSPEHNVSLHDLDESKQLRDAIASGEYQKQLQTEPKKPSALLASIPEQVTLEFHLPELNKPDAKLLLADEGIPSPPQLEEAKPDYQFVGEKMTPALLQKELNVKFGDNMPTIHDDESPQRDLVNFPRIPQPLDTPPTRFHIIPESWFRFFYPKTGVTGPYIFAGSFTTFLLSKEWLVWEHELLTGVTSTIIFTYAVIKYGPMVSDYFKSRVKKENDDWENWRLGHIDMLEKMQDHYKNELKKADLIKDLYDIRRQDVTMQLEREYRQRLETVYNDTRRRLNYLVAVADSQRQIAHKNLVNWVINNAVSSIGPKQENEVLDNCIVNLKQMASMNANAI